MTGVWVPGTAYINLPYTYTSKYVGVITYYYSDNVYAGGGVFDTDRTQLLSTYKIRCGIGTSLDYCFIGIGF